MNSSTRNEVVSIKSLLNTVQAAKKDATKEVRTFYTMTGRGIVLDFSASVFGKVG